MAPQGNLFDMRPDPWELDDHADLRTATVVLLDGPQQELSYAVPDSMVDQVLPGVRVRVPLGRGNRPAVGYCVAVEMKSGSTMRLKPVTEALDPMPLLSPALLRLARWMADYYLCPLTAALETILPAGVRDGAGTRLTTYLSVDAEALKKSADKKLTQKQAAILKLLERDGPMTQVDLLRTAKCTAGPVTALRRKGLIRSQAERVQKSQADGVEVRRQKNFTLNDEQRNALERITSAMHEKTHRTILVHGVTGSGKTEVYIQAMQEALRFGRQAIVLVPEISLTPQTVERFRSRFGEVAVLHSHLTDAERHWHWRQIAEGKVSVVVGARSAVFAPTPHLGLIVLDEEHESSFKQDVTPRYHARDVARIRAEAEGVPLVLGSATPSLESWRKANQGEFSLVEMPNRVEDRPLPDVGTIDLRVDANRGSVTRGAIGRHLHKAISNALETGGQVILLLNRRGYSTHIQCPSCGFVLVCPHCEIALTHHRQHEIALCHFCDYETAAPAECPECHFEGIRYSGVGTQRLEAEVRARFPHSPCLRMDADAMQGRGSHERAFAAFREGKIKILLGTQMIAKGLDFPNVTLVGVINADTALHLPDFRAAERTFQLVTQVAGRTGRGPKGGRVLVQSMQPEHPAIQAAVRHDYAAFARGELPIREALRYPPFTSMIRLIVRGPVEEIALEFAKTLAVRLRELLPDDGDKTREARILGPAPAPFAKLRGLFRFHIQLQCGDGKRLRDATRELLAKLEAPKEVQWIADVEPIDMM